MRATGGPYPQVTTLFLINNDTVATVDSVGLIKARIPGESLVTGAVEATDPESGHTTVFSKVNMKSFLGSSRQKYRSSLLSFGSISRTTVTLILLPI